MSRESLLVRTFVELTDTLVRDYEVLDFLYLLCDRANDLLGGSAAGVMLTDDQDRLRLATASSERMRVLELFEMQREEGPCHDAYREGKQVTHPDLDSAAQQWPTFVPLAVQEGFHAVFAFPLRLRNQRIGALNVFRGSAGPFREDDVVVGQALADVATVGILHERLLRQSSDVVAQLQEALDSRVVLEQAKGMVAQESDIDVGEAFTRLRAYARNHNRVLREVATDIIEGRLAIDALTRGVHKERG